MVWSELKGFGKSKHISLMFIAIFLFIAYGCGGSSSSDNGDKKETVSRYDIILEIANAKNTLAGLSELVIEVEDHYGDVKEAKMTDDHGVYKLESISLKNNAIFDVTITKPGWYKTKTLSLNADKSPIEVTGGEAIRLEREGEFEVTNSLSKEIDEYSDSIFSLEDKLRLHIMEGTVHSSATLHVEKHDAEKLPDAGHLYNLIGGYRITLSSNESKAENNLQPVKPIKAEFYLEEGINKDNLLFLRWNGDGWRVAEEKVEFKDDRFIVELERLSVFAFCYIEYYHPTKRIPVKDRYSEVTPEGHIKQNITIDRFEGYWGLGKSPWTSIEVESSWNLISMQSPGDVLFNEYGIMVAPPGKNKEIELLYYGVGGNTALKISINDWRTLMPLYLADIFHRLINNGKHLPYPITKDMILMDGPVKETYDFIIFMQDEINEVAEYVDDRGINVSSFMSWGEKKILEYARNQLEEGLRDLLIKKIGKYWHTFLHTADLSLSQIVNTFLGDYHIFNLKVETSPQFRIEPNEIKLSPGDVFQLDFNAYHVNHEGEETLLSINNWWWDLDDGETNQNLTLLEDGHFRAYEDANAGEYKVTAGIWVSGFEKWEKFEVDAKVLIYKEAAMIANPGLKQAIRETIDKPEGTIYSHDLVAIKNLNARERNIESIEGIQHLTNLEVLALGENQITDLSALKGLEKLRSLNFSGNQVTDISVVAELDNLRNLVFDNNKVEEIPDLGNLANLWNLNFSDNQVEDISGLKNLTSLQDLTFSNNRVSDISALEGLEKLEFLLFAGNKVSSLEALPGLENLDQLNFANNNVKDISALGNIVNLKWLVFPGNQVKDLSPLENLTNLSMLIFDDNQVTNISPLVNNEGFGQDDSIHMRGNPLELFEGSQSMQDINALVDRGVSVDFDEASNECPMHSGKEWGVINNTSYDIYGYSNPLPNFRELVQGYGIGHSSYPDHLGIDWFAEAGTDIFAICDGEISYQSWDFSEQRSSGRTNLEAYYNSRIVVVCDLPEGDSFLAIYGHVDKQKQKAGERVEKGDKIGVIAPAYDDHGNRSFSLDHLHFGIKYGFDTIFWQGVGGFGIAPYPLTLEEAENNGYYDPLKFLCENPASPMDDELLEEKVIFLGLTDEYWDIYSVNIDGSGLANLTDTPADDTVPDVSPGLNHIAFASDRDGRNEIYVMRIDGSNLTRLTDDESEDLGPVWSPDGSKIAFISDRAGGNTSNIFVMNADGSAITQLTDTSSNDTQPAWSPDGESIVFVSERDGVEDIFIMEANGSVQTNLTQGTSVDTIPAFSKDGLKISFVSEREGDFDLWVMDTSGGNLDKLTTGASNQVGWYSWSPDGSRIAFDSETTGVYEIYTVEPDGTNLRQLTDDPESNRFASWTWFGSRIAYLKEQNGSYVLYLIDPDDGDPVKLSDEDMNVNLPSYSPVYEEGGGCFISTAM